MPKARSSTRPSSSRSRFRSRKSSFARHGRRRLQYQVANLIKFLEDGNKTKITLRFRGREMAHQEIGMRLIERVRRIWLEHGVVEQFPKMEGRQMVMVLSPKPGKK